MADLTVNFRGDASNLNQSIATAKASLASFAPSATAAAKASLDALSSSMKDAQAQSAGASAGWRENLRSLSDFMTVVHYSKEALDDLNKINTAAFHAVSGAVDATVEAFQRAPGAIESYAEALAHGSGAAKNFIVDNEGVAASIGRTILAASGTIQGLRLDQTDTARTVVSLVAASGALDAFRDKVTATGVGLKQGITNFLVEIERIPGVTDQAAAEIEAMFGSLPNYTVETNNELIKLLQTISDTGEEAKTNAAQIKAAMTDDSAAGGANVGTMVAKLADNLKDTNLSAQDFRKNLQSINQLSDFFKNTLSADSASAFYDTIIAKLKTQATEQKTVQDADAAGYRQLGVLGSAITYMKSSQLELQRQENEERKKTIDLLTAEKALAEGIKAAQSREQTFQTTIEKANPLDTQITDIQSKIDIIQGRIDRSAGDTPKLSPQDIETLVRTVAGEAGGESAAGQLAVAAVALNRLANGNFGDSLTAVLKAGNGSQFNVWKPGDATGMQNLSPDSAEYKRILDTLSPLLSGAVKSPVGGALNYYNPTTATAPFAMDNRQTIGHHDFGTAKNSPDKIDPLDGDDLEGAQQALEKLQDQYRQLIALKEGGTATDKASLAIAEANAKGMADQVEDAKKLLSAKQEDLAGTAGGTQGVQLKAQEAVAQAQTALRTAENAEAEASAKVQAQAYEAGSFEQVRVLNEANAQKLAGMKEGTAEYNNLLAEMITTTKKAVDQEVKDRVEGENVAYENSKRVLEERASAIHADASEGTITRDQELAQIKANLRDQEDLERSHQTTLATINEIGTAGYRKAIGDRDKIAEQFRQKDLKAEQDHQAQVLATYRSSFDAIGQTVSSSIMAMIEHTGNFKDLLANVAKQLVTMFIENRVKAIAELAAQKASEIQLTLMGETAKTGAVTAGETARTGATVAGEAAASATKATSVLKSISSSAAEVYAGIFGFLSPGAWPIRRGTGSSRLGNGVGGSIACQLRRRLVGVARQHACSGPCRRDDRAGGADALGAEPDGRGGRRGAGRRRYPSPLQCDVFAEREGDRHERRREVHEGTLAGDHQGGRARRHQGPAWRSDGALGDR